MFIFVLFHLDYTCFIVSRVGLLQRQHLVFVTRLFDHLPDERLGVSRANGVGG